MLYKNHLLVSNAVAIPLMEMTDTLTIGGVLALSLGVLIPDIDKPKSYIGRRTRGVSDIVGGVFGHRGLTHSLTFVVFIGMVVIPLTSSLGIASIGQWFTIGVFLHILEDSFSNRGVSWLLPLSKKKYHVPLYTTGGLFESLIGLAALIWLIIFVLHHYFVWNHTAVSSLGRLATNFNS